MTDFVLNIPDHLTETVTDCLCAAGGYADATPENAKQTVIDWITATVQNVQQSRAQPPPVVIEPITGLS